ncbi:site-specific DNA-methyltransferase [Clostridium carboxidivorans]|uniref:site-specific DNA-methyltransferase n=1 Tax=Clostridium carboxidivorans TaxID=217159 RepID=UPI0001D39563|nr:site-specific DNA-methyltransferase [Clostridium carboxidivorans]EFG90184.1 DNA (cytosine-5-)-methyltransferase [Clostridium carboxidivorans P7]
MANLIENKINNLEGIKEKNIETTEKISGQSLDIVKENILKLKEIFPEVFCEDKIDFERLQDVLGNYIDDKEERYRFEWYGKSQAIRMAQTPSRGTLRPFREESKNWDTTENLYIEGDNLEVLKLLQKSYQNKIKMIYIDPPYNTGNDFVYKDDYKDNLQNYFEVTGQVDDDGNKTSTNSESSGRYHTNWLNMMYPRLRLARNLLKDDGVIFISIDDNEFGNLKKVCDDIFGEDNFLGNIVRATGQTTGQDSGGLGSSFDYVLAYTKISGVDLSGLPLTEHDLKRFDNEDERGKYAYDQMRKTGSNDRREDRPNMYYSIKDPDGNDIYPIAAAGYESCWRFEKKTYDKLKKDGFILWKKTKRGDVEIWWPYVKYYLEGRTKRPSPLWNDLDGNKKATRDVRLLFDGIKVFDYSKPIDFIQRLICISPNANNEDIILDFFSGSASTANAVMSINADDLGKRRFIMIQLPEQTDENSEACKAGYKNICEIGKERIRRAGEKIVQNKDKEGIENLDIGFKVFKLDTSNIKPWNPDYENLLMTLDDTIDNFVPGRFEEDVVYEVMLKYGIDLTYPVDTREINGKKVFSIGFGALIICLDSEITLDVVQGMVDLKNELKPEISRFVFKDNGFKTDSVKTNAIEILKRNDIKDIMSI